jgi:thioredoxin reductase
MSRTTAKAANGARFSLWLALLSVGSGHLESLVLQDTASGARRSVPSDALFVLIGAQPGTQWLGEAIARDHRGFILTGPDLPAGTGDRWRPSHRPLALETSLPGVFAAGDVRHGSVKRVASAVGEGAAAIPLIHSYLRAIAAAQAAAGRPQPPSASTPPARSRPRGTRPVARAHRAQRDRHPTG